jgi:DNA-binding CsgD family transcriptional regulator
VSQREAVRNRFLPLLSVRQIEIGALRLDGCSQSGIAELLRLDVPTVRRELRYLKRACERVGAKFPDPPPRITHAADECQISDELYASL